MSDSTPAAAAAAPEVVATPAAAAAEAAAPAAAAAAPAAAEPAAAEEDKVEEADSTAEYQAVVQLKPVEVSTGEEQDETLYKQSENMAATTAAAAERIAAQMASRSSGARSASRGGRSPLCVALTLSSLSCHSLLATCFQALRMLPLRRRFHQLEGARFDHSDATGTRN